MKTTGKITILLLSLFLLLGGCTKRPQPAPAPATAEPAAVTTPAAAPEASAEPSTEPSAEAVIPEDTECDDKACVAEYLSVYWHLPSNYMSKKDARSRGWNSGALSTVLKGKAIGGDRFGNMEGYLPKGYTYTECDIDTIGKKKRGEKRIVYTVDGQLIYYTEDHYETFELLYGEE